MDFLTDQSIHVDLSDAGERHSEDGITLSAFEGTSRGRAVAAGSAKRRPKPARRRRKTPDPAYLETLRSHGGWMSACSVAAAHGHSWYIVAHALQRLTEDGMLEADVIEVAGVKRVREHSRVYRARPADGWIRYVETLLPGWLAPQAILAFGQPRRVRGSASLTRWGE